MLALACILLRRDVEALVALHPGLGSTGELRVWGDGTFYVHRRVQVTGEGTVLDLHPVYVEMSRSCDIVSQVGNVERLVLLWR